MYYNTNGLETIKRYRNRMALYLLPAEKYYFPRSFPVDAMHLFYQNIQKRMFDHWRGKFDATRKVLKKKVKISKKESAKTTAKAKQSVQFSNQRNKIEVDIEDDLNEDLEDTESDLEKLEEDQDDRIPQYKSSSN